MNKHLELFTGLLAVLFVLFIITSYAAPPDPPVTVFGYILNQAGARAPTDTNVSINDTNSSQYRLTTTSGPDTSNTGFYQADINGSNGDRILVTAFNRTHFGYNTTTAASNAANINTTLNDTRLSAPIPVSPANRTLITSRGPTFIWNNSFDRVNNTGMANNYSLELSSSPAFTFTNSTVIGINETNSVNTTFTIPFDLMQGTWYWRVQAFGLNTSAISNYSITFNFTIASTTACSLPTDAVDFGILALNRSNNTFTNVPRPIIIKNTGNSLLNISINASHLWNSSNALNPSIFYQWRISDNVTGNTSFTAANITTLLNMNTVRQPTIDNLRYTNATFPNPAARVELNITAPSNEIPGTKTSSILLTCEG